MNQIQQQNGAEQIPPIDQADQQLPTNQAPLLATAPAKPTGELSVINILLISTVIFAFGVARTFSNIKTRHTEIPAVEIPTATITPSGSLQTEKLTFSDGTVLLISNAMPTEKKDATSYTVNSGEFTITLYSSASELNKAFLLWTEDSDGNHAGGGQAITSDEYSSNGITYKKYVLYYNPIGITASGKYDPEVSSVLSTTCIADIGDGKSIAVSARDHDPQGLSCKFVKVLSLATMPAYELEPQN